jgi:hypothetical protein
LWTTPDFTLPDARQFSNRGKPKARSNLSKEKHLQATTPSLAGQ